MSKVYQQLSRRNLLRYLGNAALFLPVMRTFNETQVFGADVAPKRAVFFYYPSGIIPDAFMPAAGPITTLPGMTAPLMKVKDSIIVLRDSVYNTGGSHQGGMNYAITGVPDSAPATSIDTILGDKFKGIKPIIRLGVNSNFEGGGIAQSCSFLSPNTLAPRQDNPSKAFADLFGGSAPTTTDGGTTMTPSAPTTGLSKNSKVSLLDYNIDQINSLQKKLGSIEKAKLDSHLSALRELERQVNAEGSTTGTTTGGTSTTSNQCTKKINETVKFDPNDVTYDAPYKRVENYNAVADMMNEICIQALACRMTNVVLLQHGHSVFEMGFNNGAPGVGKGHHSMGHYGAEGSIAGHTANQAWMMGKLANLLSGMGACAEGDKSVLYNSVVLAFSELGDSELHSMKNMGIVLAGNQGGYFKTGRCVSANGATHNKTLVSIMQSFGLPDNFVGDPKETGVMPGLTG